MLQGLPLNPISVWPVATMSGRCGRCRAGLPVRCNLNRCTGYRGFTPASTPRRSPDRGPDSEISATTRASRSKKECEKRGSRGLPDHAPFLSWRP